MVLLNSLIAQAQEQFLASSSASSASSSLQEDVRGRWTSPTLRPRNHGLRASSFAATKHPTAGQLYAEYERGDRTMPSWKRDMGFANLVKANRKNAGRRGRIQQIEDDQRNTLETLVAYAHHRAAIRRERARMSGFGPLERATALNTLSTVSDAHVGRSSFVHRGRGKGRHHGAGGHHAMGSGGGNKVGEAAVPPSGMAVQELDEEPPDGGLPPPELISEAEAVAQNNARVSDRVVISGQSSGVRISTSFDGAESIERKSIHDLNRTGGFDARLFRKDRHTRNIYFVRRGAAAHRSGGDGAGQAYTLFGEEGEAGGGAEKKEGEAGAEGEKKEGAEGEAGTAEGAAGEEPKAEEIEPPKPGAPPVVDPPKMMEGFDADTLGDVEKHVGVPKPWFLHDRGGAETRCPTGRGGT